MANYNIKIALTKLPGAKVMNIQGEISTRKCVVIPIDNSLGVVQDEYEAKNPDGSKTIKYLNDVQLNLTAFSFREPKFGHSHGIKVSYNMETLQRVSEEEIRKSPFIGNMSPWSVSTTEQTTGTTKRW